MSAGEGGWSPFGGLSKDAQRAAVNTSAFEIRCKFKDCGRMIQRGERMIPWKAPTRHDPTGQAGWWKRDGWQCLGHVND